MTAPHYDEVETWPTLDLHILLGRGYIYSNRRTFANDATASILLDNPSDSGTDAQVYAIFRGEGQADIDLTMDVTVDSAGTSIDPINLHTGSNGTMSITGERDGNYSGGTPDGEDMIPSASAQGIRAGSSIVRTPSYVLGQGSNMLHEITNQSGGNAKFIIEMAVIEVGRGWLS